MSNQVKKTHDTQISKQKLDNGTISKVLSSDFSKDDLDFLWEKHNRILKEAELPAEKYTRTLADLIRELRDVSEKLILAGAISDFTSQKDTASYVWKQIKDRNIHCNKGNFYQYFSDEQKRDYQTPAFLEKMPDKTHKHDFSIIVGNFEGIGEIRKCIPNGDILCQAKMIDGLVYENIPDQDSDIELTKQPKKEPIFYEEENEYFLFVLEKVIQSIKSVQQHYLRNPAFSLITDEERFQLREDLLLLEKSIDFINEAYNDKTKIPKLTEHLLIDAYTNTNNWAGGVYLQYFRLFGGKKVEHAKESLSKLITPKQTGRAMAGRTIHQHQRYDPKTEKEAMDMNFYGIKCTNKECKSFGYRVDYDQVLTEPAVKGDDGTIIKPAKWETQLVCFVCRTVQKPRTFKLPNIKQRMTVDWES